MKPSSFYCGLLLALVMCGLVTGLLPGTLAQSPAKNRDQKDKATETIAAPIEQEIDVVEIDTDLTTVLMTATDKTGRFVTTLARDDIRILEDGSPQQIEIFEHETERPLSLALVFDTSGSQARTLQQQKEIARLFLKTMFRQGHDKVAVISFAGQAILEQVFTSDLAPVEKAIDRLEVVTFPIRATRSNGNKTTLALGPGTAIYDTLFLTCLKVVGKAAPDTRRAIILLTDGMDNQSRLTPADAVNAAVYTNTIVYTIGIGDEWVDKESLKYLGEETGGRRFLPKNEKDLRSAFDQIEQELRSQYLIAYTPTNKLKDGKRRVIAVEITNPLVSKNKVKLRYRNHYFVKNRVKGGG